MRSAWHSLVRILKTTQVDTYSHAAVGSLQDRRAVAHRLLQVSFCRSNRIEMFRFAIVCLHVVFSTSSRISALSQFASAEIHAHIWRSSGAGEHQDANDLTFLIYHGVFGYTEIDWVLCFDNKR